MSHDIDPAMKRMQLPDSYPVVYPAASQSSGDELRVGDRAVLGAGDRRDAAVDGCGHWKNDDDRSAACVARLSRHRDCRCASPAFGSVATRDNDHA